MCQTDKPAKGGKVFHGMYKCADCKPQKEKANDDMYELPVRVLGKEPETVGKAEEPSGRTNGQSRMDQEGQEVRRSTGPKSLPALAADGTCLKIWA